MATKPFNNTYVLALHDGFVVINGEQIVKIEALQEDGERVVVLHLSDGSKFTLKGTHGYNFYNDFMKEITEL